jgi:ribonuclease HI
MVSQPQFLLFCDARASDNPLTEARRESASVFGRWHFVLERLDGIEQMEAADSESSIHPDRLALLSVVRGLEALEQPSRVNLVTTSRYVSRGLKYGLSTWRESDYQWERFGVQKPIRNADLWQRVDQALQYHGVTCRLIQSELASQADSASPEMMAAAEKGPSSQEIPVEMPQNLTQQLREAKSALAARSATEKAVARSVPEPARSGGLPSRLALQTVCWEIAGAWANWWRRRQRPALLST